MQKKMKILKDALLKERQEKDASVKIKKDLEKELERTKAQFQEKVILVKKCNSSTLGKLFAETQG